MFWVHLAIVLLCIFLGVRIGGLGLGIMGGIGTAVLVFVFRLPMAMPPIDVILIILAVITAAAAMQAAGGLDYLVALAEKVLRKNPKRITFMAPIVTWLFTFGAGTGHVAYSVMPVIAEVAREAGVRPERPMSIAAIASQQAITCSPVSAATATLITILAANNFSSLSLIHILIICIPATFCGCMIGAFVMNFIGKELKDDEIFKAKVADGEIPPLSTTRFERHIKPGAQLSVALFLCGAVGVVIMGLIRGGTLGASLKNFFFERIVDGKSTFIAMPVTIQLVMLVIAACIVIFCKIKTEEMISGTIFRAGIMAVVAIFGIGWLGDTLFQGHREFLISAFSGAVQTKPWVFAFALFALSILMYSQAATTRVLMPVAAAFGMNPYFMIAMFPAVNGYFFLPNYPTCVAAINFDRTGTTRIGRFVLNHSFMIPGLVATASAITIGFGIAFLIM